ncbi:MAG: hypothetical protein V3S14_06260, partial [Anaerolineae bacterium]
TLFSARSSRMRAHLVNVTALRPATTVRCGRPSPAAPARRPASPSLLAAPLLAAPLLAARGLLGLATGAHAQVHIRAGDIQIVEEHL